MHSLLSLSLQDGPCRFNPATIGARCTGYVDINTGDENDLQDAVANIGPISVAIDASNTFKLYESGESCAIIDTYRTTCSYEFSVTLSF